MNFWTKHRYKVLLRLEHNKIFAALAKPLIDIAVLAPVELDESTISDLMTKEILLQELRMK